MDFFEHQEQARRQTRYLIFMFILAVIAIVTAVDLVVLTLFVNLNSQTHRLIMPSLRLIGENSGLIIVTSLCTLAFIAMASLFRITLLGGGGGKVARSLGGTPVSADTQDPLRRRLLNVVEEMAIASGVPMPEVYVLEEEQGLNAFAAGFTSGDAAIAVTRGSLETFDRAELQGVIAHEFSHVLNGDMRLNMRLLGLLFGIQVISIIGYTILRNLRFARIRSSRSNNKDGAGIISAIFAFGAALAVIGYIGLFFARLIKAGVSRQREYLADASAVQFTRQTTGIAGALKKIGFAASSLIQDSHGEEVSHMLFANGLSSLSNLYATHPPIEARIRALEPGFDPAAYQLELKQQAAEREAQAERTQAKPATHTTSAHWNRLMESLLILTPGAVSDSIGNPRDRHIQHAAGLRRLIPPQVYQAAQSNTGALQLTLSLLLDRDEEIRERQLNLLATSLDSEAVASIAQLYNEVQLLGPQFQLPLMDLTFPVLKQRPRQQIDEMLQRIEALIGADNRVDSFEYLLSRTLLTYLQDAEHPQRATTRHGVKLVNSLEALQTLFSVVARLGHKAGDDAARDAYQAGMLALLPNSIEWPAFDPPAQWVKPMDAALRRLDGLPAVAKGELAKALTATISHDARVTISEAEMLRAVCAILHCPIPPFVLKTHEEDEAGKE